MRRYWNFCGFYECRTLEVFWQKSCRTCWKLKRSAPHYRWASIIRQLTKWRPILIHRETPERRPPLPDGQTHPITISTHTAWTPPRVPLLFTRPTHPHLSKFRFLLISAWFDSFTLMPYDNATLLRSELSWIDFDESKWIDWEIE